jgi:hypothetical protein
MWFAAKDLGLDMTFQHIDKDGNLTFGTTGTPISAWTFYSDWKLVAAPKGGVIAFYGANADKTNDDATTINTYANKLNEDGSFGIYNSLIINEITKNSYLAGDTISVNFNQIGDGFYDDNRFKILISNNHGDFTNAKELVK